MQNHCLDAEVSRWLPGCYWHVEKLILECSGWFLCGCTGQSQQNSSPGVIPGHKMWLTFLLPCKIWSNLQNFADKKGSLSIVNTVIMYKALVTQRYCLSYKLFSVLQHVTNFHFMQVEIYHSHTKSSIACISEQMTGICPWKIHRTTENVIATLSLYEAFVVVGQFYHPSRKPIRIFKKALVFAIASTN